MRWRTAEGLLTRPNVNELNRRRLLEQTMAAGVSARFGALQKEHLHVEVKMKSVGGTYCS